MNRSLQRSAVLKTSQGLLASSDLGSHVVLTPELSPLIFTVKMMMIMPVSGCHEDCERVSGTWVHLLLFLIAALARLHGTSPHTSLLPTAQRVLKCFPLCWFCLSLPHTPCTLDMAWVLGESLRDTPLAS